MTTPTTPHAYRIVRVADPRSRGACAWYEIEGIDAAGGRWHVATCDDRREARELVRQIEAADAARAAAIAEARTTLAAARQAARRLDDRRGCKLTPDAIARVRRWVPSLAADRRAIAHAIRAARATLRRFSA